MATRADVSDYVNNLSYTFQGDFCHSEKPGVIGLAFLFFKDIAPKVDALNQPLISNACFFWSAKYITESVIKVAEENNIAFKRPRVSAALWLSATLCTHILIEGTPIVTTGFAFAGIWSGFLQELKPPEYNHLSEMEQRDELSYVQSAQALFFLTAGIYLKGALRPILATPLTIIAFYYAADRAHAAYQRYMEGDVSPSVYFANP